MFSTLSLRVPCGKGLTQKQLGLRKSWLKASYENIRANVHGAIYCSNASSYHTMGSMSRMLYFRQLETRKETHFLLKDLVTLHKSLLNQRDSDSCSYRSTGTSTAVAFQQSSGIFGA